MRLVFFVVVAALFVVVANGDASKRCNDPTNISPCKAVLFRSPFPSFVSPVGSFVLAPTLAILTLISVLGALAFPVTANIRNAPVVARRALRALSPRSRARWLTRSTLRLPAACFIKTT